MTISFGSCTWWIVCDKREACSRTRNQFKSNPGKSQPFFFKVAFILRFFNYFWWRLSVLSCTLTPSSQSFLKKFFLASVFFALPSGIWMDTYEIVRDREGLYHSFPREVYQYYSMISGHHQPKKESKASSFVPYSFTFSELQQRLVRSAINNFVYTCCSFYRPKASLFRSKWRNSCVIQSN